MTNKEILKIKMVRNYNKVTATHNYILGFERKGLIYACELRNASDLLTSLVCIEMKKGNGAVIRYNPTNLQKDIIIANAKRVEIIGSVELMEAEKVNHRNNRGDWFEYQCAKVWNAKQNAKQNAKFTECGDIRTTDGIEYQCKYGSRKGKATFISEKTLAGLGLN